MNRKRYSTEIQVIRRVYEGGELIDITTLHDAVIDGKLAEGQRAAFKELRGLLDMLEGKPAPDPL